MSRSFFVIAVIIILASVLVIYYALGGFEPIDPKIKDSNGCTIAGKYFEGSYKDPEIEELFFQMKQMVEENQLPGPLVIINFQDGKNDAGEIKYMIGSKVTSDELVPSDLSTFKIPSGLSIVVDIEAHNLVMPQPEEVLKEIEEFAENEGHELVDYSVEMYVSGRCLIVEVPVAN